MASKKANAGDTDTFPAGPFTGVMATNNPFDDVPNQLTDALNGYFPDAVNGGEFAARAGFLRANPPVAMSGVGGACAVQSGGTFYNFVLYAPAVGSPKLYRLDAGVGSASPTYTDVTPVGVTISIAQNKTGLIFMLGFAGNLIFHDSVNQPWVGTNLSSTPITATKINADGASTAWVAVGKPTIYVGSLFFVSGTTFANVTANLGFIWCEPNQPTVGYMQSGFADFWNDTQTNATPITGVYGTNNGLYIFREYSISIAIGTPSVNFASTATQDAVAYNVGCNATNAICAFGQYLYFPDVRGRPWRVAFGGAPEPIWLQMRTPYEFAASQTTTNQTAPQTVNVYTWAVIEPTLNLYLIALWGRVTAGFVTLNSPPVTLYGFDAVTGHYVGRWTTADASGNPALWSCGAILQQDSTTIPVFSALNGNITGSGGSYSGTVGSLWSLQDVSANVWTDDGVAASILAQTGRLGYGASIEWAPQRVRAITSTTTPVALTIVTGNGSTSVGNATPPASNDGTNLAQWTPLQVQGRGIQLQLSPTTTTSQWRLFHVEADLTASVVQTSDA